MSVILFAILLALLCIWWALTAPARKERQEKRRLERQKRQLEPVRPMTTMQKISLGLFLLFFLIVLPVAYTAYWYVYGRERDLFEHTEMATLPKEIYHAIFEATADPNEDKRIGDLMARRDETLSETLKGRLTLKPNNDTGSTLDGLFMSYKENWVTNRAYVHIRILEKRRCGEQLQNPFSDTEWDKHCAADPNYSVMDTVDGQSYQCFVGAVGFGETAKCHAETFLAFDPNKQSWDFFFSKVTGHPKDPLNWF